MIICDHILVRCPETWWDVLSNIQTSNKRETITPWNACIPRALFFAFIGRQPVFEWPEGLWLYREVCYAIIVEGLY